MIILLEAVLHFYGPHKVNIYSRLPAIPQVGPLKPGSFEAPQYLKALCFFWIL